MSAIISSCGQYRYALTREHVDPLTTVRGPAMFIMLNPSTADAAHDDPTIRRCKGFASLWGCSGIVVANLYALRATDPRELWKHASPVGPENDAHLQRLVAGAGLVVCAWGAHARPDRVDVVRQILAAAGRRAMCLGVTKNTGAPRHPLYVPYKQALVEL